MRATQTGFRRCSWINAALLGYQPKSVLLETPRSQAFLAYREGQVCGRIAAILNGRHNRSHKEKRGFFGFFESSDDRQVAERIVRRRGRAGSAERGMSELRGPCNPSLNYECGLLVEGFDTPPYFMMTYNKPYYGRLIEGCGFHKSQDLYAFWGHIRHAVKARPEVACRSPRRRPSGSTLASGRWTRADFAPSWRCFSNFYNQSLGSTWGFVPLSAAEIRHMGGPTEDDDRARAGLDRRGGWQADRGGVWPARLQSADQADRRPAVSVWLYSPAAQPPRN